MKTFTFYYRMMIDIKAESREEADKIFENTPFSELYGESDYIEVNDVYEHEEE